MIYNAQANKSAVFTPLLVFDQVIVLCHTSVANRQALSIVCFHRPFVMLQVSCFMCLQMCLEFYCVRSAHSRAYNPSPKDKWFNFSCHQLGLNFWTQLATAAYSISSQFPKWHMDYLSDSVYCEGMSEMMMWTKAIFTILAPVWCIDFNLVAYDWTMLHRIGNFGNLSKYKQIYAQTISLPSACTSSSAPDVTHEMMMF